MGDSPCGGGSRRLSSLRLVSRPDWAWIGRGDVEGPVLLGNRAPRAFVFSFLLLADPAELGLRLWRWNFLDLCRCRVVRCRVVLCFPVLCRLVFGALVVWGRTTISVVRRPLSVH